MDRKLFLIHEKNLYILLHYENLDEEPKYRHCFSYADRPKKQALAQARQFAENMNKKQNLPLKERL